MNNKPTQPLSSMPIAEQQTIFTLEAISKTCAVQTTFVMALIEEGVVTPYQGHESTEWKFTSSHLRSISIAARLQRDLGINTAGAALVLQLLDEIETLRAHINVSSLNTKDY